MGSLLIPKRTILMTATKVPSMIKLALAPVRPSSERPGKSITMVAVKPFCLVHASLMLMCQRCTQVKLRSSDSGKSIWTMSIRCSKSHILLHCKHGSLMRPRTWVTYRRPWKHSCLASIASPFSVCQKRNAGPCSNHREMTF